MATCDYICCGECGNRIVYDGDHNGRDRLENMFGEIGKTVQLLCPDCVNALRAELDRAYAEMHKQRPAIRAVFDREVWHRVTAWGVAQGLTEELPGDDPAPTL